MQKSRSSFAEKTSRGLKQEALTETVGLNNAPFIASLKKDSGHNPSLLFESLAKALNLLSKNGNVYHIRVLPFDPESDGSPKVIPIIAE